MKVGVNILCLCAAVIGLIALLLPWLVSTHTSVSGVLLHERESGSADIIRFIQWGTSAEMTLALGMYLFAMGAALCLWTPIGGVLQLSGIVTYVVTGCTAVFGTEEEPKEIIVSDDPGIGALVAIIAAVVAIASLLYPVFIGTGRDGRASDSRFLSWSFSM